MRKPSFSRELCAHVVELSPAQRVQKIPRKRDPEALPRREPLLDKMIDAPIHRVPHLGAESS
jgi:hypothetical protein